AGLHRQTVHPPPTGRRCRRGAAAERGGAGLGTLPSGCTVGGWCRGRERTDGGQARPGAGTPAAESTRERPTAMSPPSLATGTDWEPHTVTTRETVEPGPVAALSALFDNDTP